MRREGHKRLVTNEISSLIAQLSILRDCSGKDIGERETQATVSLT